MKEEFSECRLEGLPPARGDAVAISRLVASASRKIVVLDDDPTGTQTVHDLDVLTEWSEPALAQALKDPRSGFFVLTNSRSLPEPEAIEVTRQIAANLHAAARATGQDYSIISRSDSTLRGHFPAEIDALEAAHPGGYDAVIVAPAFFEAGRFTVGDVHYLSDAHGTVPVGETEFARDATFGYRSSNLCEWIEEKTGGRVGRRTVASISLATLRHPSGAELVQMQLLALPHGTFVVVNAAEYGDLEVFVHGLLLAESTGRRFLCRTAASFVRVRAGVGANPLLDSAALRTNEGSGGLVVVGSYTGKSTSQLEAALGGARTIGLELDVGRLAEPVGEATQIARLSPQIEMALREDRTVIVFTSRARQTALGRAGELTVGRTVSDALVRLTAGLGVRPRFLIAKGGITSSDLAVRALGVRRALILGQAEPGVPVWRTGPESRWPGLTYVVFPGNVGDSATLSALLRKLGG